MGNSIEVPHKNKKICFYGHLFYRHLYKNKCIKGIKYSMRNIVNYIAVFLVIDSNYKYHPDHFATYRNIKPLYCAPRTNIVL